MSLEEFLLREAPHLKEAADSIMVRCRYSDDKGESCWCRPDEFELSFYFDTPEIGKQDPPDEAA